MGSGTVIRTGIDLVVLSEFQQALTDGGEAFLRRVYQPSEAASATLERRAAIFAAKEAAFKALALPRGDWHVVEVVHDGAGRPSLRFAPEWDGQGNVVSCDLSITHSGGLVIAVVAALLREPPTGAAPPSGR